MNAAIENKLAERLVIYAFIVCDVTVDMLGPVYNSFSRCKLPESAQITNHLR